MLRSIKRIKRLQFTRMFIYLTFICLLFIILILDMQLKFISFSSFPLIDSYISHSDRLSFRGRLISERLASHSRMYDNAPRECNTSQPLSDEQKNGLSDISKLLISLRQQMVPYPNDYFHGRGIVLTIGPNQLHFAKVNLKMLQYSGTRLPVQIWYSSTQVSENTMIDVLNEAPKLNSSICCFDTNQCKTRTKTTWQLNPAYVYKPRSHGLSKPFPYKPAAMVSATFDEVLFLDSDAYVTRDPEELFLSDPMYLKFGALFFPDSFKSRQHPSVWTFFNTRCAADEYEVDSATILVNKKRVWNGLYMAKLMNDNHEPFYHYATEGDKDTFRLAFRYMDVKYYIAGIPCSTGTFDGTRFCGYTLCKTDSLGQHIYVNHIHVLKYEGISYTRPNLEYTRIGLVDPYNHSFLFDHCRIRREQRTCFQLMQKPNPRIIENKCYTGEIPSKEIEDRKYMLDQPLLYDESRDNRAILSKTDNLTPGFLDNLLKHLR